MLKNITRSLPLSLLVILQLNANNAPSNFQLQPQTTTQMLEQYGPGFTSLEHKNMGDLVKLHLPGKNSSNEIIKLQLPNGIKLSYGEIVMYAADMFGDPKNPISNCSEHERAKCFEAQFMAMAVKGLPEDKSCSNPITQFANMIEYMNQIEEDLAKARIDGIKDWVFYDKNDVKITRKFNRLTCGGSFISEFVPYGTYIKLAEVNYDHFVPDSLIAYKTGHQYALETAQKAFTRNQAGQTDEAKKLLELAYAQNAYANHYLSDSFSAGHMRVPRRAFTKNIIFLPTALKLLLANLMHNEDNRHGLNVVNAEGTSWIAYGDGYLLKPEAETQRVVMLDAMQRSADGIYHTYKTGIIPEAYSEIDLLPNYNLIEQLNDTAPLFKMENGVLLKRVNNEDYYDNHWTIYWSGFLTLLQFRVIH